MRNLVYPIKLLLFFFTFLYLGCGERNYEVDNLKEELNKSSLEEISRKKPSSKEVKSIHGKVIKISDGDTFNMIFENNFEVRVRLNGIDSPERKQPYSNKAKQGLAKLIFSKEVTVLYEKKDRYGRVLGEVIIDDVNVNQEMVRHGWAWHFKQYSDDSLLADLEIKAREDGVGLWSDPNAIPPWEFRKLK